MKVILDSDNKLRNPNTLEIVGFWFKLDGITYYFKPNE